MLFNDYRLNRLAIGKLIGLVFGIMAFICTKYFTHVASATFSWGLLLWYVIFGYAVAASINSLEYIKQECNICIPWYIICIHAGFFFSLALAMLTERKMHFIVSSLTSEILTSPYWLIVDSTSAALVIGFVLKMCCKPTSNS